MFKKVLVANRGEIAVRVLRTLREMGIASVAVYSEADAAALHVRFADEARCIGGAAPGESYLDVDAIVAAARATGAEAVHPGYGFLSENPALAAALTSAGLVFVGPPAEVLARAGLKTAARQAVRDAGVPVVPGQYAPSSEPERMMRAAEEIGFPVVVKAAAGGGGKGMRVVRDPAQLAEAVGQAASEARAAFSDGSVYLERYLDRPRHVELQILADQSGSVVHLFERECSIQRRHQKIIEESPSPGLDAALRARMGAAAIEAAAAVGYVNAGTVEFLLDRDGRFYFLEINARLQVEHPVTEAVLGLDMVRLQLEIAAGGKLPFAQPELCPRGHAIECRVYAEAPEAGFAPSPGRVSLLRAPSGPGVRHDEGVAPGSDVPRFYDPILAKVIVWAPDRPAARARMVRALREYVILGVRTPIELMIDLLESDAFRVGATHTGLVAELLERWSPSSEADELALIGAAVRHLARAGTKARSGGGDQPGRPPSPWATLGAWDARHGRGARR
jgi:acetyl-CoA carboxylase biotin carboxylase subunit